MSQPNRLMTKAEWQATPQYQDLRQTCCRAQGGCCVDCGATGGLELHHLVYPDTKIVHNGPGWWGDETDSDVVGLCRDCHHQRHRDPNGDFWRDPQEVASHWEGFEEALDKD